MDCGVNGSFKFNLRKFRCEASTPDMTEAGLEEQRHRLLEAAAAAAHNAFNPYTIREAFRCTGISPWDITPLLANDKVIKSQNLAPFTPPTPAEMKTARATKIDGRILTQDGFLEENRERKLQQEKAVDEKIRKKEERAVRAEERKREKEAKKKAREERKGLRLSAPQKKAGKKRSREEADGKESKVPKKKPNKAAVPLSARDQGKENVMNGSDPRLVITIGGGFEGSFDDYSAGL